MINTRCEKRIEVRQNSLFRAGSNCPYQPVKGADLRNLSPVRSSTEGDCCVYIISSEVQRPKMATATAGGHAGGRFPMSGMLL